MGGLEKGPPKHIFPPGSVLRAPGGFATLSRPNSPTPSLFNRQAKVSTAVYAVISDRSRQATVRVGDVISCDLNSDLEPGSTVTFDDVLLLSDEGKVTVGKPNVSGAKVTGEVIGETKGEKIVVFRFKRRKNVRVKTGHRQRYTDVKITNITG